MIHVKSRWIARYGILDFNAIVLPSTMNFP